MTNLPISTYAALGFAAASGAVVLFQLALALGAPWGELTLGGRWRGPLPARARLIPLLSVALLVVFGSVVLERAGLRWPGLPAYPQWCVWLVVGYCALGCVANTLTPSPRERRLWLPVVVGMLTCSLVVATA